MTIVICRYSSVSTMINNLTKTGKKLGFNSNQVYHACQIVEDNFWMGAFKIVGLERGPTMARPEKEWLQIKVRIRKTNGAIEKKRFCYDCSKIGTDVLENYIKEELMR